MRKPKREDLKQSTGVEDSGVQRGVILRLLGVVAIILGILDSMLSWRGGFELDSFFIALILGGAILYIIGTLARSR